MNYRCPNCHTIFEGETEKCPKCGVKLRFSQGNNNLINTSSGNKPVAKRKTLEDIANEKQPVRMTTNTFLAIRLKEIDKEIKKEEKDKGVGVALIIISFFALWPLVIFGIIQVSHSNKRISELQQEKQTIIMQMSGHYIYY